jgi:uncharacterized membrane protein
MPFVWIINNGLTLNNGGKCMEMDTYRYLYSAIAQSMAALIALGGIFTIFALQTADKKVDHTCRAFKEHVRNWRKQVEMKFAEDEEMKDYLERKASEVDEWLNKDVTHNLLAMAEEFHKKRMIIPTALVDYFCELRSQDEYSVSAKEKLWQPTICIIILFVVSCFLLFNIDFFNFFTLYIISAVLFLFLVAVLVWVYRYIKFLINVPKGEILNTLYWNDKKNETIKKRVTEIRQEMLFKMQTLKEVSGIHK